MKKFEIFNSLTIKANLLLLSGFLLLALVATSFLGYVAINSLRSTMKEMRSSIKTIQTQATEAQNVLGQQQKILIQLEIAQASLYVFGEYKYWLTDLSASWLNEAENNADTSREKLESLLKQLAVFAPQEAKSIILRVEKINERAIEAVDAYVDRNRVKGNAFLAETRQEMTEVSKILTTIAKTQQVQAEKAKQQAVDATGETITDAEKVIAKTGATIAQAEKSELQTLGCGLISTST